METKKVLILGIDGYLGWALALRLGKKGHEVYGIDNLITRNTSYGSRWGFSISTTVSRGKKKYI
jgi:nucleoside-diphosphate-sugar epimerase